MVLGEIDLDPATSDAAQALIRATKYYTKQSDGLRHEWHGRIWLNPPYAQPLISQFISKLAEERLRGHVTAAIVLTHNYTDTRWFHKLIASADAICFTRGRVRFHDGDKIAAPTQGQLFTYLGDDVCGFAAAFEPVGSVMPCRFAPHVLESLDVA
jgi:phage N-6-adenine-methyltransferase